MNTDEFSLQEQLLANYESDLDVDGVSGSRLASRLHQLALIGLTKEYGSNRFGFSKEEYQAKKLVAEWMKQAGLEVIMDGAGNVFGRLEGKDPNKRKIFSGSHVDSVPNGGHFDGPLGVLSALEVVEAWRAEGYEPERTFEVVIFTDEEGSRFNSGYHGSEAVVGVENIEEKLTLTDQADLPFKEVLASAGFHLYGYMDAKRNLEEYELFIEVHIEQGKRLERENLPCGIVTGIAGTYLIKFTFTGEAGHAGNTPMNDRQDALVAASEFIQRVPTVPGKISDSAVATVGRMSIAPNGVNVIPGEVNLYVDMRDITKENQDGLVEQIKTLATEVAEKHQVKSAWKRTEQSIPVPIHEKNQEQLKDALEVHGIRPYYLPSGAGHDAMIIGSKIPSVMLFVRSKNGYSHRPDEWSDLNDCIQAVHVLKTFIEKQQ